jgi:GntR family transcriptional regulator
MLITVNPQDERPLYVKIMDEVRRGLVTGALRPEDPLPSVRDLASDLAINPRTVRQAYSELERDGVVDVKRGLGTFVAADSQSDRRERRALARSVAKRALLEAIAMGFPRMSSSKRSAKSQQKRDNTVARTAGDKE